MTEHSDESVRDRLLPVLLEEIERTRRRRARRRLAARACAVFIVAAGLVGLALLPMARPGRKPVLIADPRPAMKGIERVPTDPGLLDLWRVKTDPQVVAIMRPPVELTVPIQFLDDAALLSSLAEIGQPAGLVRTREKVWIVPHGSGPGQRQGS